MTSLFLMAGLPGAGKTTVARRPAEEHGALRPNRTSG
ncbi:AAA family ATPase [Actinacidiphila sp. bgisy160]